MSALRSFSGYAQVAPFIPLTIPCNLVNADGYAAGAGWLQFHDKATAPSAAAVPLKSINVPAAGPLASYFATLGPVPFRNGMAIAMSSTEGTYTALATAFDVWGEVEEFELQPPTLTTVTAALSVDALDIWAENVHHRLYSLFVDNREGDARWVHIHPRVNGNVVSGTTVPLLSLAATPTGLADGGTRLWEFGAGGLLVQGFVSAASAAGAIPPGTLYTGCSAILSTTAGVTTFANGNIGSTLTAKYF